MQEGRKGADPEAVGIQGDAHLVEEGPRSVVERLRRAGILNAVYDSPAGLVHQRGGQVYIL